MAISLVNPDGLPTGDLAAQVEQFHPDLGVAPAAVGAPAVE